MNIGLIAHDAKKTLLQNLCIAYRSVLAKHTLYATGTSGRLVEEATGLNVRSACRCHHPRYPQSAEELQNHDLQRGQRLRPPAPRHGAHRLCFRRDHGRPRLRITSLPVKKQLRKGPAQTPPGDHHDRTERQRPHRQHGTRKTRHCPLRTRLHRG